MAEKKTTAKKAAVKKAELSLEEQLVALRNDLLEYRKSHAAGELVNPRAITKNRKDIARVMTQLNAKKEAK
ncbi:MAG TPA: 50S ribosomal protein L29 [Candidatus Saccharibacteria bacterium]|nr:50S ribosomal protein L29 [Candidatus Saccharibacteria bacterium]HRJ90821.1 50S ribosomal protein L29 [Candidatus Saccharibacteria bacterium]